MQQTLTAAIKLRVEAMDKLALQQLARAEGLQLSDLGRRAVKEYIRARTRIDSPDTQQRIRAHA